jgi:hypothetical protein
MKKLKTLLTLLMIITMVSGIMAQTSREYAVEDLAQLETDLAAGTYDVYILTTSGGMYDFTASNITIGADAVIKAAEGLAEKPVISRTNNTTADAGIFRTQNVTINLGLEGLIFDGTVTSETANQKVIGLRAESTVHVDVNNCVFRNFTNINGVFRLQGAESSMDMRNSVFHDITQRVIQPWQVDVTYGHFNIDNCLFYNINGAVVWYRSINSGANLAIGTTITVNHSTFHNIATNADGVFRGRDNNTGEVKILNSVFTNIADTRPLTNAIKNLTVDYCYLGDTDVGSAANDPIVTNLFSTAPVYEDAAAFNFRITNADDFIVANGEVAGVDYYNTIVEPEKYQVTFTVTFDDNGTPTAVEGAKITITGVTGTLTTDADGKATIELENGTYTYSVEATDYISIADATFMVEDAPANVDVTLELIPIPDLYLVTFTVTFDDDGTPAAAEGAEINITGVTGTLTTDVAGVATIELESGIYIYAVEATGFVSVVDASFEVEDAPAGVDVTLELIPVPDVPTLTMAPQEVSNRASQIVTGTSNKTGLIVIVKDDAPQATLTEILAAAATDAGASADVTTAGEPVTISTEGLQPGVYNGYAVDADENVSDPVLAVVTVNDPHSREYPVDQIAQLQTDLATGAYDEYILTTSGGVYDLTSQITITSDAVIKAAEGLAEKPVIQRSSNTSGSQGIFRIQTNTVSIVLEGLIFDGTFSEPGTASPMGFRAESTTHFTVNDCIFRNFDNSNGVFRLDVGGSSIDVRNSFFHDCKERVIHLYTPDEVYGDVNIYNCIFYNINGTVVFYRSSSGETAIGTTLTVNHSTFHNIKIANANDGVIRGRDNNTGETRILNSVFTEIEDNWPIIRGFVNNPVVDYCYFGTNSPHTGGGPIVTNTFTTVPVFEDPANNIFRITNADDFIVASGDIAGVTWYYAPRVNPKLLLESATQVKVVFSRPVDETSAETLTNYTLSGTFGLTGNPTAAELVNEREVILTVGDVSAIPGGETIVVTVAGVADTNGMMLADINNVAVFQQPVAITVIAESQTLSNAPGQVAKVQSSLADGYVFIVLENEPQQTKADLEAAVAAGKGAFAPVTAALTDMEIAVFNLHPGTYFAYAVSTDGDLSDKSTNSITITDGIAPVVNNMAQTANNGPDGYVNVQSNEGNGHVYIILDGYVVATVANLDAAVAENKGSSADVTAANTDIKVSTTGLEPGDYFAYAVDAAGNISEKGTVAMIIIQDDTSTEEIVGNSVRVFARNNTIYLQAPESLHNLSFEVFDIQGRKIHSGNINGTSQVLTTRSGIYIVRFGDARILPARVLIAN